MSNTCLTNPSKIIYKVTSPSGKVYIGKTVKGLHYRKAQHLKTANNGSGLLFSKAIRKYGDSLIWEVIDTANTSEELSLLEVIWIKYYNSFGGGYNLTVGGDGRSMYETEEEVQQARKSSFKKYTQTPKYKELKKSYRQSDEYKKSKGEYLKKYYINNKEKLSNYSKRYVRTDKYKTHRMARYYKNKKTNEQ